MYRKPQKNPVEEHCASTRKSLCKAILQRRLRGDSAPIDGSFHAGRRQNTLPWNAECIYVFADGAQFFVGVGDSAHPVRFSHTFVGADAHIGPYRVLCVNEIS